MLVKIHCSEEMKCDYDEKKRKNIKEKEKWNVEILKEHQWKKSA